MRLPQAFDRACKQPPQRARVVMRSLTMLVLLGLSLAAWATEPLERAINEQRILKLIALLGSNSFQKRERAGENLAAIGSIALPYLNTALKSPDLEVQRRVKETIAEIRIRVQKARQIIGPPRYPDNDDLRSSNPYTRLRAMEHLSRLRLNGKQEIAFFLQGLDDPDAEVRKTSLIAYSRLAEQDAALRRVLAVVRDERELAELRELAILRLDRFIPAAEAAKQVVHNLLALVNSECEPPRLRAGAILFLSRMGNDAASAIPNLLRLVKSGNPQLRGCACSALGVLGKNRPEILHTLLQALADPDPFPRGAAAWGLKTLNKEPERCVEALVKALLLDVHDQRSDVARVNILSAIGSFGPKSADSIPTVLNIALDPKESLDLREHAVRTLWAIGQAARQALVQPADLADSRISSEARFALKELEKQEKRSSAGKP